MAHTLATIWLCGALPTAFLVFDVRPRTRGEWLGGLVITLFWPIFLGWAIFGFPGAK